MWVARWIREMRNARRNKDKEAWPRLEGMWVRILLLDGEEFMGVVEDDRSGTLKLYSDGLTVVVNKAMIKYITMG